MKDLVNIVQANKFPLSKGGAALAAGVVFMVTILIIATAIIVITKV